MANDTTNLYEVLRAAQALLEARENQMVTSEEWDALQHAVAVATPIAAPAPVGDTPRTRSNVLRRDFQIDVTITSVSPHVAERSLDDLQARCHHVVSALVTAFKYQRPADDADDIGTEVTTERL